MNSVSYRTSKVKQNSAKCTNLAKGKRRKAKAKPPAQRRYWLDIGKAISLELIAAKYDEADAGGDGAQ